MIDNKFTWVTFFKEVHEKIHNNYTAKQLANIANKIFGHIKDIDDYGNEVPIQEMTPINFIAYFNRRLTLNNKIQYCQKLKEIMNLTSETPVDFDGIPEFNNQNCLCMPFKKDRAHFIIQEQWEISKQILENNIKTELFDKILSNAHPYIGLSYLSRFCFIVKPEKYYPYDKQMAINLKAKMPETYKGYNDYCKLLKYTYPEKTSYELSYEAFMENNNKQYKKQTNQKKYWLYSAGEKSYKWDEFYKDGIMAIGWDYLGDLTKYSSQEEIADKITKEENKTQYPKNDSKANWEFAKDMQIGDIVYVKKGLQDALIGRGIVKSDYIYDANRSEYKSIRKVEWTHNDTYSVDFNVLDIKQWNQKTLTEISQSKYKDFHLKIEDIFMNKQTEGKLNNSQVNIPLNQILYGPPGTGKTYNTVVKAMEIIGSNSVNMKDEKGNFKTSYSFDEYKKLKEEFDNYKNKGQIEFVTFHQSYSYEEFVEGIKPYIPEWGTTDNADVKYIGENGIFKEICKNARQIKTDKTSHKIDFSRTRIFKMSLGANWENETEDIYNYCLTNNVVALGWGDDKDFSGCNTSEEFKNLDSTWGAKAVEIFKNWMRVGDIILISNGNSNIKAIAQITGEYEYHNDREIRYCQFRNVNWLYNGDDIPVAKFYDKKLSQQAIYGFYNKDKEGKDDYNSSINTNVLNEIITGNINSVEEKPYILIIDEINRGDVSKIFGELITLIEEDKRIGNKYQMKTILPYSKESFGVPNNLYIIGTMNTADRSIALLDTALRRRFDFEEIMPRPELLGGKVVEGINLQTLLTRINERITNKYDRDHQIGHSYLMGVNTKEQLERAYKNRILPLLNEYFYNESKTVAEILNCSEDELKTSDFISILGKA